MFLMREVSLYGTDVAIDRDNAPSCQLRGDNRKVDVRLPGEGKSNIHGTRPVHLIISVMKWIQTSGLSPKKCLSLEVSI